MGDDDAGCGAGTSGDGGDGLDDQPVGLGQQRCGDATGCPPGGVGNLAGTQYDATLAGNVGPWFVFGR